MTSENLGSVTTFVIDSNDVVKKVAVVTVRWCCFHSGF